MTLTEQESATYEQALEEERLILAATELIEELLEQQGINRKELADRLGKSKAHVTQILSGERNFTLRTLAEVAYHLGHRVHLSPQPRDQPPSAWYSRSRRRSDIELPSWVPGQSNVDPWNAASGSVSGRAESDLDARRTGLQWKLASEPDDLCLSHRSHRNRCAHGAPSVEARDARWMGVASDGRPFDVTVDESELCLT